MYLGALNTPQLGSVADIINKGAIFAAWQQVAASYPADAFAQSQSAAALQQYNQAVMFQWPAGTAMSQAPAMIPAVGMPDLARYPAPQVTSAVASIVADTASRIPPSASPIAAPGFTANALQTAAAVPPAPAGVAARSGGRPGAPGSPPAAAPAAPAAPGTLVPIGALIAILSFLR